MGNRSPGREAIEKILADGEWHDREELVRAYTAATPISRCWRKAEYHRSKASLHGSNGTSGPPARVNNMDPSYVAEVGGRMLTADVLYTMSRAELIETRGEGSTRQHRKSQI